MSDVLKKGIVDPWRVADPIRQPERAAPASPESPKIDLAEIDFDSDLRVPRSYTFRAHASSVQVCSREIATDNDALRDLVRCLFDLVEAKDGARRFEEIQIGFSQEDRQWLVPANDCPTATLRTSKGYLPSTALYFLRQSHDAGMLRLVKLLCAFNQGPGASGQQILKRWGVIPMLR